MDALDVLYGSALITEKECKLVEQCKAVQCYYESNDRVISDTYSFDQRSGLWDWTAEEEDEEYGDVLRSSYHRPSINTETVIETIRDSVLYCDAAVNLN